MANQRRFRRSSGRASRQAVHDCMTPALVVKTVVKRKMGTNQSTGGRPAEEPVGEDREGLQGDPGVDLAPAEQVEDAELLARGEAPGRRSSETRWRSETCDQPCAQRMRWSPEASSVVGGELGRDEAGVGDDRPPASTTRMDESMSSVSMKPRMRVPRSTRRASSRWSRRRSRSRAAARGRDG